jgi:hypothetical protein
MILEKEVIEQMKLIVKEKLPEVAAGEIKVFIEKAEALKLDYERISDKIKQQEEQLKEKDAVIEELKNQLSKHNELNLRRDLISARLQSLTQKENEFELIKTRFEMSVLEKYVANIERFSALMFAHPESIKSSSVNRYGSMPLAVGMGGSSGYISPDSIQSHPTTQNGSDITSEKVVKNVDVDSVIKKKTN